MVLTETSVRRARISKRAQSHDLNGAGRTHSSPPNSALTSDEQRIELGIRYQSSPPRNRYHDGTFYISSKNASSNYHGTQSRYQSAAGAEQAERSEQSVFAELGGSDSAMDITKKVCWPPAKYIELVVDG